MRIWLASALAFALAFPTASAFADDDEPVAAKSKIKPKATDASVAAIRDKLAKARDELRAVIAKPLEKLTPAEQKRYDAIVADVRAMADGADATAAKLTEGLSKPGSRDSLSELGEMQQLKMQMAMDRISKADHASSNTLKKMSDTLSQIIQNMK
jgi:hypothetical protein